MPEGGGQGRVDAEAAWRAALDAVRPESLVAARLAFADGELLVDGGRLQPPARWGSRGRIVVVGGGKAAAGVASALERLIVRAGGGDRLAGLVSVPEEAAPTLGRIEIRGTRPAGANLPTPAAVAATDEMLALLDTLGPDDLVLAVVTGGGSALMAAPRAGLPLDEKIAVTRFLSQAGADIRELNVVRQAASRVKAGGLARGTGAGRLVALVLSDVIGDPLDAIASAPCLPVPAQPARALAILERFGAVAVGVAPRLTDLLRRDITDADGRPVAGPTAAWTTPRGCRVDHVLLGSNATAVNAAAVALRRLGHEVTVRHGAAGVDETAETVGRRLAAEAAALAAATRRDGLARALVEGGEATVAVPAVHGRGGRNQQTVLAAAAACGAAGGWPAGAVIASIGTDGEDGPTSSAGGCIDATVAAALEPEAVRKALVRCDAEPLLAAAGGLVVTGPTGTNVADLRLVITR